MVLTADRSVRTLKELGRRRIYEAEHGRPGEGGKRHGRRGRSLVMKVPRGTEVRAVREDGSLELIGELLEDGSSMIVAGGGEGGWGNTRFATSVRRAPRIAQRGRQGDEVRLRLDLKLLADVGMVGLPNAGKSTLLRAISAARPKVGDYPFTTLEPILGVVEDRGEPFVAADLPGLIEGAHEGAGLGLDFLRHVERTKVLLYLLDGSSDDPLADLRIVDSEVSQYRSDLTERPRLVAVNKIDQPEVRERVADLRTRFEQAGISPPLFISAAAGEGLEDLVDRLSALLAVDQTAAVELVPPNLALRPRDRGLQIRREDGAFRVEGDRAVAFAEMMPIDTEEGRAELWRRFRRWGVSSALRRAGASPGDRVRFGRVELELEG